MLEQLRRWFRDVGVLITYPFGAKHQSTKQTECSLVWKAQLPVGRRCMKTVQCFVQTFKYWSQFSEEPHGADL